MSADRSPNGHGGSGGEAFAAVPEALKAYPQWMCWRRGNLKPDDGYQKPPVSPHTGYLAGHNEPGNRGTFEQAVAAVARYGLDGISFVPTPGDPFTLVDFDKCRDPRTGEITNPKVEAWLREAHTYAEVSPSGTGLRVIAVGSVPHTINNGGVEMYSAGQQLTITGDHLPDTPTEVREAQGALTGLFREYASGEGSGVGRDLKIDEAEPPVKLDDYGLAVWRGEKPTPKEDGSGEISRSRTLFKIAAQLAKAGATAKVIRSAVAERDVALGYRKYLDRPNERAEREYTRIALKAVEGASGSSSSSSPLVPHDDDDDRGVVSAGLRVVRFADMPPAPNKRPYVVSGLIPARFPSAIYGDGGAAKSLLAASVLQAVARGDEDWMGFPIEEPGPGLYVDFELDEEEQERRMRHLALGRDPENPGVPEDLYYLCAAAHPARKVLQLALDECRRLGVRLMVLDSLGIALQGDAEAARDVIGFFRNNIDPFRAAGVALLIVDHQSKKQHGEDYANKTLFGSVYKGNLTRSVFQVEPKGRGENELTVRLRHQKTNFGPKFDPFEVRLRFNEAWVRLEKADLDSADLASEVSLNAGDKIQLALKDGPRYPDELAEATELALGTVKNELGKLRKRKVVEPTGEKNGNAQEVRLRGEPTPSSSSYTPRDDDDDDDRNDFFDVT